MADRSHSRRLPNGNVEANDLVENPGTNAMAQFTLFNFYQQRSLNELQSFHAEGFFL